MLCGIYDNQSRSMARAGSTASKLEALSRAVEGTAPDRTEGLWDYMCGRDDKVRVLEAASWCMSACAGSGAVDGVAIVSPRKISMHRLYACR